MTRRRGFPPSLLPLLAQTIQLQIRQGMKHIFNMQAHINEWQVGPTMCWAACVLRVALRIRRVERDKQRQDDLAIFAQLNFQLLALRVSIFVHLLPSLLSSFS